MGEQLQWMIENQAGGKLVKLSGPVTEESDLSPLLEELSASDAIRIDLAEVHRINSCGVREWVNFVRALPDAVNLELAHCSTSMVHQINMISNFVGDGRVLSVHAPFVCVDCGHEETFDIEVATGQLPTIEDRPCTQCSDVMEFDDITESYFAFLLR